MSSRIDEALAALAARQCGTFSRAQVIAHGGDDSMIWRRLRSGRWVRLAPGVYGLPGVASTYTQSLWIGVHAAGESAAASHEAAGSVRWLTGFHPGPVVVTVPHGRHPDLAGVTVHQSRDLTPLDVGLVKGLPVTTVARTLVDMAPRMGGKALGVVLDDATNDGKLTTADMHRCFKRLAVPGRGGMLKLAGVLDERGPGYVPPASVLERGMFDLVEAAGLPAPIRQMPHPGRQIMAGCVDAGWRPPKLIIEADGRRWHTRIQDLARDHWRDAEATRVGYETLRLLWEHIMEDRQGTIDLVREVYELRLALHAPR